MGEGPHTLPEDVIDPQLVPVELGDVIEGKYRVERIVGIGGMACVVAAHHLELDQPIAIKFLSAEQTARSDAVQRFLAEARAAARLQSPHVARVLDVGTTRTSKGHLLPFMVMELLVGVDLDRLLEKRRRLPVGEAVEYLMQACEGVAEAHAIGIVHRDIKPGNLFVTLRRDGAPVVKLLDFGISKVTSTPGGAKAHGLTADRELMGSPGYMSPEQIRSSKDVDVRTDIWSLGIVLYELLVGRAPFRADNVADLLVMILHSPAPPVDVEAPDVPAELAAIVRRCLEKNRTQRFATVDELVAALMPFRSTTPIVLDDLPRALEVHVSDAVVAVSTIREAPKRRILLTAGVSFAAVGMLIAGIAFLNRDPASTAPLSASAEPPVEAATALPTAPAAPTESAPIAAPTGSTPIAAATGSGETSFEIVEVTPKGGPSAPKGRPGTPRPQTVPKGKANPTQAGATTGPRQRTEW